MAPFTAPRPPWGCPFSGTQLPESGKLRAARRRPAAVSVWPETTDSREAELSWVYWLFAAVFALGLYRAFHGRHQQQKTGRSGDPLAFLSVYGTLILVAALFAGYLLAGQTARVVIVVMLLIGAVGPPVASFIEGYSGQARARNVRRWMFIVLAALAAIVVFSFLLELLFLLLVIGAVVAIVIVSGVLLGVIRR